MVERPESVLTLYDDGICVVKLTREELNEVILALKYRRRANAGPTAAMCNYLLTKLGDETARTPERKRKP